MSLITEPALLDGYYQLGYDSQNLSLVDGLTLHWVYTADTPPNEHIVDSRTVADNVRLEHPGMSLLPLANFLTPAQHAVHTRIQHDLTALYHAALH